MVRRVAGLLFAVSTGGPLIGRPPVEKTFARILLVHDPEDLVHPMDAPIAEGAVGIVEVIAKAARMNGPAPGLAFVAWIAAVVRPERSRTTPQIPIDSLGVSTLRSGFSGSAAIMDEGADHPDLADLAGADELAPGDVVRRDATMCADLYGFAGLAERH